MQLIIILNLPSMTQIHILSKKEFSTAVAKSSKQFDRLLLLIEGLQRKYRTAGLPNVIGQFISSFYQSKRYADVISLTEKISFDDVMQTNSVFEVAYSYAALENQKLAQKYYRAYLDQKGKSSAAANNLALIEEKEGNLVEAERLLQLAIDWDSKDDTARTNHKRVLDRLQKENEKKRAYQRAVDLYKQEEESVRFYLAKLYATRTDDQLIFLNEDKVGKTGLSELIDGKIDIDYFLNKKYLKD